MVPGAYHIHNGCVSAFISDASIGLDCLKHDNVILASFSTKNLWVDDCQLKSLSESN